MGISMEKENGIPSTSMMLAFFGGALVGAAAGVLFAPKSGRESRDQLKTYLQKTGDRVRNFSRQSAEKLGKVTENGRRFMKEAAETIRDGA